jgi:hypothetical protein
MCSARIWPSTCLATWHVIWPHVCFQLLKSRVTKILAPFDWRPLLCLSIADTQSGNNYRDDLLRRSERPELVDRWRPQWRSCWRRHHATCPSAHVSLPPVPRAERRPCPNLADDKVVDPVQDCYMSSMKTWVLSFMLGCEKHLYS